MLGVLGGRVYDPQNGIAGEVRDIWVKEGRVVSPEEMDQEQAEIIDASGLVVMPGGVDIHSHIVGAKVNAGRKFRPEDHRGNERERTETLRSGVGGTVPTTHLTGYLYAEMGYTTVMEAATAPLVAQGDEGARVEDGYVREFLVSVPANKGRSGRLHYRRVAHLRIQIPSEVGSRYRTAHTGTQSFRALTLVAAMIFRAKLPPGVHFSPHDVAVNVHAPRHDHQTRGVDDLCLLLIHLLRRDHTTFLDPNIPNLACDAILRIIDATTQHTQHHFTASMI